MKLKRYEVHFVGYSKIKSSELRLLLSTTFKQAEIEIAEISIKIEEPK